MTINRKKASRLATKTDWNRYRKLSNYISYVYVGKKSLTLHNSKSKLGLALVCPRRYFSGSNPISSKRPLAAILSLFAVATIRAPNMLYLRPNRQIGEVSIIKLCWQRNARPT